MIIQHRAHIDLIGLIGYQGWSISGNESCFLHNGHSYIMKIRITRHKCCLGLGSFRKQILVTFPVNWFYSKGFSLCTISFGILLFHNFIDELQKSRFIGENTIFSVCAECYASFVCSRVVWNIMPHVFLITFAQTMPPHMISDRKFRIGRDSFKMNAI